MAARRFRAKRVVWALACGAAVCPTGAWAQDKDPSRAPAAGATAVEFNTDLLTANGGPVDISRFRLGRFVAPGQYRVDLWVNLAYLGRFDVRFVAPQVGQSAQACLGASLLEQMGVRLQALSEATRERLALEPRCVAVTDIHESASASHDDQEQRLNLSVPQALLASGARARVPPEQLDAGITAGLLNYSASAFRLAGGAAPQTRLYLGLRAGLNLGAWRFRHQGAAFSNSPGGRGYQAAATFAQTDLIGWRSRLTLGDAFTSGELFTPLRFRGVQIESDDRMLADAQAGFVPVVRGVARTNAKVTIRQRGQVVHDVVVAPGPFAIDDFYGLGPGADLDVTVLEADGTQQNFVVPYASVPLLRRAGSTHYAFSAGTVRDLPQGRPGFLQGTWQHGLSDRLTGYAGLSVARGYSAWLLGAAMNTPIGGVGLDLTRSRTQLAVGPRESGSSLRLTYFKALDATGTNVSLASYWFSTRGYFNLLDALVAQSGVASTPGERPRSLAQVQVRQNLPALGGQLFFTMSERRIWSGAVPSAQYTLGYDTRWGRASLSLQWSRSRGEGVAGGGNRFFATVSLPLETQRPHHVFATAGREADGRTSMNTTLVGVGGDNNALSYSLSARHTGGGQQAGGNGLSANLNYRAPVADLSASVGRFSGGQNQLSLGANGAVLWHAGGLTWSQPTGDTVGLVEARGAAGARLTSGQNQRVDGAGFAVVPYLTPYRYNTVDLDPKGLSTDVELQSSSQRVAPLSGSVVRIPFETRVARSVFLRVTHPDGAPLPFGAAALDEEGRHIGTVAQSGRLFVRVDNNEGRLELRWGEAADERCLVPLRLPPRQGTQAQPFEELVLRCEPQ